MPDEMFHIVLKNAPRLQPRTMIPHQRLIPHETYEEEKMAA
jgi:hypothetical protein